VFSGGSGYPSLRTRIRSLQGGSSDVEKKKSGLNDDLLIILKLIDTNIEQWCRLIGEKKWA